MSLFDKLFKRNKEENLNEVSKISIPQQTNYVETVSVKSENEQIQTKQYKFEFVLTDESIHKRVLNYVRPITSDLQILNLQVAYGVKELESGCIMVRSMASQTRDGENGQTFRTTHFLLLTENDIFETSYTGTDIHDKGTLTYETPDEYANMLKQAFDFWRDWPAHKEFERACSAATPGFIMSKRNYEICQLLRKELKKYQEQQKKLKEAQRQHMEINCEEDAKKLFFLCNTDCHRKMKEDYDEETIKAFEQYATRENQRGWVLEECSQILEDIINGDREKIYDKLSKVDGRCSYWLGAEAEKLVPLYTKACEVLWESKEERFVVCIHSFLGNLKNSNNPACATELLDMTEAYYKENYAQEYEQGSIAEHPQKFKQICCMLRGRMKELAMSESTGGFRFVLTNQEDLRSIVLYYRNKYNDDSAVKETVAELNCAYGVENDEMFLTALSDTAEQTILKSWDRLSFVGILRATGEIIEVYCKRENADGSFGRDYCAGPVKEHWGLVLEAMEFYRNQPARKVFFDTYKQEHEDDILTLIKASHKGLLSKFKRHYEKEYKLAGGNALRKVLLPLIDLCEERGGSYGYKNTKFGKPATPEEIIAWEQEHGLSLPQDYKAFLNFANGGQFFGDSECIFGLKGLTVDDEFLKEDYIHLGNMIGDGTMICMAKENGRVYIMDHGEYEDKGTFEEFLEYFVDFLSGF